MKLSVILATAFSVALFLQPAGAAPQETPSGIISGKVLETMNSGGYTYMQLEKDGKKIWVAIPQAAVTKGQIISVNQGMVMTNFESKTLKKTFDQIIFSDGLADMKGRSAAASPGSKAAVVSAKEKISVEKASGPNAYSIADIYKNRTKLNNKEVMVRGKVVKVSPEIMQRNWIHLQDGSGNAKKGTHNLVATSKDLPVVGDVITVTGVLHKDKDFGGNYRYAVIIEDASIKK